MADGDPCQQQKAAAAGYGLSWGGPAEREQMRRWNSSGMQHKAQLMVGRRLCAQPALSGASEVHARCAEGRPQAYASPGGMAGTLAAPLCRHAPELVKLHIEQQLPVHGFIAMVTTH